jgi:hypothetical protein
MNASANCTARQMLQQTARQRQIPEQAHDQRQLTYFVNRAVQKGPKKEGQGHNIEQ